MKYLPLPVCAGLCLLAVQPAFGQASFRGIGFLSGGATPESKAYGVSDDGTVVVGYSSSDIGNQAFRWTASGAVGLGILSGGLTSQARKVSGDGKVIVGESGSTIGTQAFRWTSGDGMVGLGDLAGGNVNSSSVACSHDGSVIAGLGSSGSGFRAMRWTPASGMVSLGLLGGGTTGESHAFGITADGTTICGYSTNNNGKFQAYRWTSGIGFQGLPDLPGGTYDSRAYGMSGNGLFVVGRSDSGAFEAFRWSKAGMIGLGYLMNYTNESRARDVSDDGEMVIGRCDDGVNDRAFVWLDYAGMKDLQNYLVQKGATGLNGWSLQEAYAMSPDGHYLVGYGLNPNGQSEGWIATMPNRLSTNVLASPSTLGGGVVAGTVSLGYPAATDTTVSLSSSDPDVASVPASIVVPAGQVAAVYKVTTFGTTVNTAVTVGATFDGATRSASLTVKATTLKSLSITPSPIVGSKKATGKISLNGVAPASGAVVSLSSSNPTIVPVPTSVTVPAGLGTASFTSLTKAVSKDVGVTLTASYGGVNKSFSLTVKAATLSSIKLSPNPVASGKPSYITLTLNGQAATGGHVVNLDSSNPALATLPASATIPAGSSSLKVKITTSAVSTVSTADITATDGTVSKTSTLTVNPPALSKITLKATSVTGGAKVGLLVALTGVAPTGGVTVDLASSDGGVATVPASVTVPAGATSVATSVTTKTVSSKVSVTISASYLGVTKSAVLTVNP